VVVDMARVDMRGAAIGRIAVVGRGFDGQTGEDERDERLLGEDMNGVDVEVGM
jgi:hypothetical protein